MSVHRNNSYSRWRRPHDAAGQNGRGMYRLLVRLCLLILLLCSMWPVSAVAREQALHIPSGRQVQGNVATASRDIVIDGRVLGDVTSLSGQITINGYVRGDVVSYSGPVDLGRHAQVDGHVLALAGGVSHTGNARIAGQIIGDTPIGAGAVSSIANFFDPSPPTAPSLLPRLAISLLLSLLSLVLILASIWRWPRRTEGTARMLRSVPWRSLLLGMLTTLLLGVLFLLLSMLLAVSLIGLPFMLALVLLLQIPYIFGMAGLSRMLGGALARHEPLHRQNSLGALLLMAPVMLFSLFVPLGGMLIFYILASAGLGAVILSRGGTFAPSTRFGVR